MSERRSYNTKQRELIRRCLVSNAGHYLTVRRVCALLEEGKTPVGHTTVYRNLEAMASHGVVLKLVGAGNEACYRIRPHEPCGQLVCIDCGRVEPLDCNMLRSFARHVYVDHGFEVETERSVLYGHCAACRTA